MTYSMSPTLSIAFTQCCTSPHKQTHVASVVKHSTEGSHDRGMHMLLVVAGMQCTPQPVPTRSEYLSSFQQQNERKKTRQ